MADFGNLKINVMRNHLLLFIIVLIMACKTPKSHKVKMFNEFKNQVNSVVFNNFPLNDSIIENSLYHNIIFPDAIYAADYCGVFIQKEYNKEGYDSIVSQFKQRKLFSANIQDTCNTFVPMVNENEKCPDYYPVPNIYDEFSGLEKIIGEGKYIVFNYPQAGASVSLVPFLKSKFIYY